jgi:hypothetical protein
MGTWLIFFRHAGGGTWRLGCSTCWSHSQKSAKTPPNKAAIGFAAGLGAAASDCDPAIAAFPNSDLLAMSHRVIVCNS